MPEKALSDFINIASNLGLDASKITTVFELGARDCKETVGFINMLPNAQVYAFECNPATLPLCRRATSRYKRAHLIEKAVSDKDGQLTFFPIDQEKTETIWEDGNPGASSLFKSSGKYPVEKYVQNEITVESTTLSSFMRRESINKVDLMWMDIQGAELMALKGALGRIADIRMIHTEVEFIDIYEGQALYSDIKRFMNKQKFRLYDFTNIGEYSADAVFVNSRDYGFRKRLELYYRDKTVYFSYTRLPKIKNKLQPVIKIRNYIKWRWRQLIDILKKLTRSAHWHKKGATVLSIKRLISYLYFTVMRVTGNDIMFSPPVSSKTAIDVFIPAIDKDSQILPYTIESIRKFVKHPIKDIYIACPPSSKQIKKIANKYKCKLIDEEKMLPVSKKDIPYKVDGEDRSGWVLQQLLKLNADTVCSQQNILIVDSDVVFIRPRIFTFNGAALFSLSDFFHEPYHKFNNRLLGLNKKYSRSFVSHTMLFNAKVLNNLRVEIEIKHKLKWYEAIIQNLDTREGSSFSEYELYGDYYSAISNKPYKLYYWNSLDMSINDYDNIDNIINANKTKYGVIAFHNYNR